MTNRSKFDLSAIDYRSLTPDQLDTLKRRIIREAQAERARVIWGAFATLFAWLRDGIAKAWKAAFVDDHPVFPSRRV